MIKKIISKLYHKYVCNFSYDNELELDEFIGFALEFHELMKLYEIKTYEQLQSIAAIARTRYEMKKAKE